MKKYYFKKTIQILILIVFSVLFFIGFFIEPNELIVDKVTLKLNKWDKKHNNIKIAVVSDIHAGAPFISLNKVKNIVKMVNREKPDLILLPGDFVGQGVIGGKLIKPELIAKELSGLKSKYGIISVLGNNDWKYDGDKVRYALEKQNITVLENSSKEIIINGKQLYIAGLADLTKRFPDVPKTMSEIKGQKSILMLSHNPDVFPFIPNNVSLTIAGHTHGGQVNLPVVGRLIVPSAFGERYATGFVEENNKDLYVSTGIGTSILPVRFRVVPEIEILTIQSK